MRLVFFVWKMIEYLVLNSFSLFYGWNRLNVVSLWCICVYDWVAWVYFVQASNGIKFTF